MKKTLLVFLLLVVFTTTSCLIVQTVQAQNQDSPIEFAKGENDLSKAYRVDFAVPDSPAFKVLGVDPSNTLRPSSVRELLVGTSDFMGKDGALTIPKNFAAEFAPILLIGGKNLTLRDYQKHPYLYRLRVSAATKREETANQDVNQENGTPTELGLGLRVSIIDKSDPRTTIRLFLFSVPEKFKITGKDGKISDEFQNELSENLKKKFPKQAEMRLSSKKEDIDIIIENSTLTTIKDTKHLKVYSARKSKDGINIYYEIQATATGITDEIVRILREKGPGKNPPTDDSQSGPLSLDSPEYAEVRSEVEALRANFEKVWVEEQWNAQTCDVAAALHAVASDPMGKNLKIQKHAYWATYGTRLGTSGQWLLGVNVVSERNPDKNDFILLFSPSTRLYIGSNQRKMFVEAQTELSKASKPKWFLNAGGEIKLRWGTWLAFSSGLERVTDTKTTNLASTFKVQLGFPDF
ncbi:hypothetical protein HYR99_27805 [Candidatus Poribacteria bacterium]|nr:hypothetical protein [Candidatus Poribacteria bacterium]